MGHMPLQDVFVEGMSGMVVTNNTVLSGKNLFARNQVAKEPLSEHINKLDGH